MELETNELGGIQEILERKEADLVQALRTRDGIVIDKSADQMDEIQNASERDLAIENADRGFSLLREVRAALERIRDNSFGTCLDCEGAINPKRLAAVPWTPRCIRCQETADRGEQERPESRRGILAEAA